MQIAEVYLASCFSWLRMCVCFLVVRVPPRNRAGLYVFGADLSWPLGWGHRFPHRLVCLSALSARHPPRRLSHGSPRSAKARQIRRNPNVEFCVPLQKECGNGYIRVAGVASIITDPETREGIGRRIPFLTEYWTGADDPNFCLIRIARVEIEYLKPGETDATTFMV